MRPAVVYGPIGVKFVRQRAPISGHDEPALRPTASTSAAWSCPPAVRSRSSTSSRRPTSAAGAAVPRPRPRAPRLPRVRSRPRVPGRVGGGLPDALGGRAALPELRVERGRHLRPADRRPLRRGARPRHRGPRRGPQAPRAGEHGGRDRALRRRARTPDAILPKTSRRLRSAYFGRRRRRPPAPAPPCWALRQRRQVRLRRRPPSPARPSRAASSAPVAAIASHTASACAGRRAPPRRSSAAQLRVALAREDQRQRDGAVEQVRAAVLAGPLGRARDVEHVVEQLEREPDAAAEARPARRPAPPPSSAPSSHAAWNSRAVLRSQRVQVALARDADVPRVLALQQLALGQRGRGVGEHAHRLGAPVARPARRTRARTAGRRWRSRSRGPAAATTVGRPRRSVGARRARRRARASPSGRARPPPRRAARRRRSARPGRQQHQQRPQPLAAGRDRRARVLGEHRPVRARELREALLELVQQPRHVRAARLDRPRRPPRRSPSAHRPECRAMIPPAVRIQRTSRRPARASAPPSASGPGKRLTEFGR